MHLLVSMIMSVLMSVALVGVSSAVDSPQSLPKQAPATASLSAGACRAETSSSEPGAVFSSEWLSKDNYRNTKGMLFLTALVSLLFLPTLFDKITTSPRLSRKSRANLFFSIGGLFLLAGFAYSFATGSSGGIFAAVLLLGLTSWSVYKVNFPA